MRLRVVAEKVRSAEVHSARAKYRESKVGRGGGSSRTQYDKIRRFVQKSVFFRRIPRSRKCNGGWGVVAEPSKKKSVDSAINHFLSVD